MSLRGILARQSKSGILIAAQYIWRKPQALGAKVFGNFVNAINWPSVMEFEDLFPDASAVVMTAQDRKKVSILIVDSDASVRRTMRASLLSLGYSRIQDVPDHSHALQHLEEQMYSHIIFEAKNTRMPAREFLISAFELDDSIVAIPSSYQPTLDDVFDLIILGAKGYIVKPFTSGALDDAIGMSTKGEPLSDAILYAKSRNEALAALILDALNKLALIKKQSRKFKTAKRELPMKEATFKRVVDLGKTFAKGGPFALREAIVEFCLEQCENPAPKVGHFKQRTKRTDKRLRKDPDRANSGAFGL
ncbi:hypothetical protein OAO01_06120 [Oligoflexia bacterium]|nr:hypothetical protein [Oligoflexia bacterium]